MINRKDLDLHTHKSGYCTGFSYVLCDNEGKLFKAEFVATETVDRQPRGWQMQVIFGRTRDADSQVYTFDYLLPRTGLPIELVAATGLKYFQLYLQEEVQVKSNIQFALGTQLQGM